MITASQLAGFFAAHAIWCVSDGDTLIPMLAYSTEDGERNMDRLAFDDMGQAVQTGKQRLASNDMNAKDAALLCDARIPIGDQKVDAIIIELRAYFSPGSEMMIAIPYTPAGEKEFRVHRPKLLQWDQCDDFDLDAVMEAFFEGVASHEKGSAIWNQALDESI